MEDFDAPAGELRAVSTAIQPDGTIAVDLAVPGHDETQATTVTAAIDALTWIWIEPRPVDLEGGGTHVDARLQHELDRRRRILERQRREHLTRKAVLRDPS